MARVLVKSIAVPSYDEATGVWTLGLVGVAKTHTIHSNLQFGDGGTKAFRIQANTVDGTDDYRVLISSGGAAGPNRGAYLEMHGNEFSSTPGRILWESGSSASGTAVAWQVNVGASSVLGHSINGNGLSVIGPTGSLGTVTGHQIYGPVLSQISSAIPQMSISAADRGYIGCNIYLDSAGGAKRSIVNAVGYSFLQLDRSATSTDTCFRVVANNDTQTNGVAGATVTTNEKTVIEATFGGALKFGPSGAANQGILLQGNDAGYTATALKYYQEGTYTITMSSSGGTAPTLNSGSGSNIGYYTRIGDIVIVRGAISIATVGSGYTRIFMSIPFGVATGNAGDRPTGSIIASGLGTTVASMYVQSLSSNNNFEITKYNAAGDSGPTGITPAYLTTSTTMFFQITYSTR